VTLKDQQQANDQRQAAPDAQTDGQWSERQLRFLKRAIAVMSIILVLGFALVIGRIVYLSGQSGTTAATAARGDISAVQRRMVAAAKLALPADSVVRNISLSGNRLAVQFSAPSGNGIVIMDLASGKTASRIRFTTSPTGR